LQFRCRRNKIGSIAEAKTRLHWASWTEAAEVKKINCNRESVQSGKQNGR
jgi:hypothetical protein